MSSELSKLVSVIQEWHASKLTHLKGTQKFVGAGTKIKTEGLEVEMSQRDALCFKLGLEAALIELQNLPFKVTITRVDDSDNKEGIRE